MLRQHVLTRIKDTPHPPKEFYYKTISEVIKLPIYLLIQHTHKATQHNTKCMPFYNFTQCHMPKTYQAVRPCSSVPIA